MLECCVPRNFADVKYVDGDTRNKKKCGPSNEKRELAGLCFSVREINPCRTILCSLNGFVCSLAIHMGEKNREIIRIVETAEIHFNNW